VFPQRARTEIRQPRSPEGPSEDAAHGVGVRPWLAINRDGTELEIVAICNLGLGKDRVVGSERFLFAQELGPGDDNSSDVIANGEESGGERLRVLGANLARILFDHPAVEVDMLQGKSDDRAVQRTG
jgi:hypothetical protein